MVLFAILSRTFAAQEGLFPTSRLAETLHRWLSFESGVILGALLVISGTALLVHAPLIWSKAGFGTLNADSFTNVVIASSLLIAIGMEITISSSLLSMIQLNMRVLGKSLIARQ